MCNELFTALCTDRNDLKTACNESTAMYTYVSPVEGLKIEHVLTFPTNESLFSNTSEDVLKKKWCFFPI